MNKKTEIIKEQENIFKSFFRGADSLPGTPYQISPLPPEKLTARNVIMQTFGFAVRASLMATSPFFTWLQIYRLTFNTPPPSSFLDLTNQIAKVWGDAAKNILKDVGVRLKNATNNVLDATITPVVSAFLATMAYGSVNVLLPIQSNISKVEISDNPSNVSKSIPFQELNITSSINSMQRKLASGQEEEAYKIAMNILNKFGMYFTLYEKAASQFELPSSDLTKEFFESIDNIFKNQNINSYFEFLKIYNEEQSIMLLDKDSLKSLFEYVTKIKYDESGLMTFWAGNADKQSRPIPLRTNQYMYYINGNNSPTQSTPHNLFNHRGWTNLVWTKLSSNFEKLFIEKISEASKSAEGKNIFISLDFLSIIINESSIIKVDRCKNAFLSSCKEFAINVANFSDQEANDFVALWNKMINENNIMSNELRAFASKAIQANTNESLLRENEESKSYPLVAPSGISEVFQGNTKDVRLTQVMYDTIDEVLKKIKIEDVEKEGIKFAEAILMILSQDESNAESFAKIVEFFEKKLLSILPEKITSAWTYEYIKFAKENKDVKPDQAKNQINEMFFGVSDIDEEKYESGFVLPARIYSLFRWLSMHSDSVESAISEKMVDGSRDLVYSAAKANKAPEKESA
jgi:hypothetical protein